MRYRVELRRAGVDDQPRIREALIVRQPDAIDAALDARQKIADLYREPTGFWMVYAVVPLETET